MRDKRRDCSMDGVRMLMRFFGKDETTCGASARASGCSSKLFILPIAYACLILTAPTLAQNQTDDPPTEPSTVQDEKKNGPEQTIEVNGDRVTLHVSGLPLADALRMLSEPTKRNIIVAAGVQGVVTASMYNVSFDA